MTPATFKLPQNFSTPLNHAVMEGEPTPCNSTLTVGQFLNGVGFKGNTFGYEKTGAFLYTHLKEIDGEKKIIAYNSEDYQAEFGEDESIIMSENHSNEEEEQIHR